MVEHRNPCCNDCHHVVAVASPEKVSCLNFQVTPIFGRAWLRHVRSREEMITGRNELRSRFAGLLMPLWCMVHSINRKMIEENQFKVEIFFQFDHASNVQAS
jgi:hypothetical protein